MRLFTFILIISLTFSNSMMAETGTKYDEYAEKLKAIGVFQGTDNGFELDREPTRLEGLIMLLRLLGLEDEALSLSDDVDHVFDDVPEWGKKYTVFAYNNGLTEGIGNGKFGSDDEIKAKSYNTFLLRALGYDDSKGDFSWDSANEFARDIGLVSSKYYTELTNSIFLRDHIAKSSYDALLTNVKGSSELLVEKLVGSRDIDGKIASTIIPGDGITFADEKLEKAIRDSFEYPVIHIQKSDLESIKDLDAHGDTGYMITNLDGIEQLSNIETLNLKSNKIEDISHLKSLTNLESLNLAYNDIQDISALSNLVKLTELNLNNNTLSSISPLNNLRQLEILHMEKAGLGTGSFSYEINDLINLKELYLKLNNINDLGTLEYHTNLEVLDLTGNAIIADIDTLSLLKNLRVLNMSSTRATPEIYWSASISNNLSVLSELDNLTELTLSSTGLNDISPLTSLTNLTYLDITVNKEITNLDVVSQLPNLECLIADLVDLDSLDELGNISDMEKLVELSLEYNNLTDISELNKLPNLEVLNLGSNEIVDISVLSDLTKLKDLSISFNNIVDINVLSNLTMLENLNISGNDIVDFSSIEGLIKLREFWAFRSNIESIEFLRNMTNLEYLSLSNNLITDISVLANMKELYILNIENNLLTDLSPLFKLDKLIIVWAKNNDIDESDIEVLEEFIPYFSY